GLDADVLPYPANAHPGYILLQEYFAFPKQYLFFDLYFDANSDGTKLAELVNAMSPARTVDVVFLLNRRPPQNLPVDEKVFRLGCTPIVNLFPKTTEPIRLDH